MKNRGKPPAASRIKAANATAEKAIRLFSAERRNVVRGLVAEARRYPLSPAQLDTLRSAASESDMIAAATLLEAPAGLRGRKVTGLLQKDVGQAHNRELRSTTLEIAYACGILNAWKDLSLVAIETVAVLARLSEVSSKDAIGALSQTAKTWGASNYLAYKLSYLKEFGNLDEADDEELRQIDVILGHTQSPFMQYSAMENINDKISIFQVARRHTNILMDRIDGDFRRYHILNNLLATPIDRADCAGFILRAVETSLIDTVRSLWVILNLSDRFSDLRSVIKRNLDPEIWSFLLTSHASVAAMACPALLPDPVGVQEDDDQVLTDDRSLSLYRRSAAFLEFPEICRFRHDVDRVVGHRLLAPLLPRITIWNGENFDNLSVLKQADGTFEFSQHGTENVQLDHFYRTYLFLRFIQNPANLAAITSADIKYIFDNTIQLEVLLLEHELKTMHLNASDEARALISLLALSLYRGKSSDPDIDFDFRANLEEYIIKNFNSDIGRFIEALLESSPGIANYLASSVDEVTLQKMYQIIDSPVAAENARREILTAVGIHLNKLDYIIEAEAIETRSKVAKLKSYFDASRMFVDSIAMKRWLGSNPSAYSQQYKELLPKITARLLVSTTSAGKEAKLEVFEITSTDAFLVERMAMDAFREFCVNNEFGIESYLGRRIRHNTLRGVMTKSKDAVLQRSEFRPIIANTPFGDALRSWEASYNIYIERMRREFLQFKSDSRPQALFYSEIDPLDSITKRNLQQLVQTLRSSGPEMLDELIISFCWRQIAPQLESASRQIRVKMTQDMTHLLDQALQRFIGPQELQIKSALEEALTSVFAQIASWFQVPQTGFVPASIPEICNIIDIEHGRPPSTTIVTGIRRDISYYGISVHRIYDCLAALLQNAFKHGRPGTEIVVRVASEPVTATNLHDLDVTVQSVLPQEGGASCVERVYEAQTASETGRDMVTEGYSGIKKVKFITRLNEGQSTVTVNKLDENIEVRFRLKVEVAETGGVY